MGIMVAVVPGAEGNTNEVLDSASEALTLLSEDSPVDKYRTLGLQLRDLSGAWYRRLAPIYA